MLMGLKYYVRKIFFMEMEKLVVKRHRESKWDSFDEFVNIIRDYVDNEYYGGS